MNRNEAFEVLFESSLRSTALAPRCLLAVKDFRKAREDAQAARAIRPEDARAWYVLGQASEHFDEALEAFQKAVERGHQEAAEALRRLQQRRSEGLGSYDWPQARELLRVLRLLHNS